MSNLLEILEADDGGCIAFSHAAEILGEESVSEQLEWLVSLGLAEVELAVGLIAHALEAEPGDRVIILTSNE